MNRPVKIASRQTSKIHSFKQQNPAPASQPATMMNGAGVTNYDASGSRPAYGFSTATTQFDEELIRRGIVSRQQALMAKGMTAAQAEELLRVPEEDEPPLETTTTTSKKKESTNETGEYDSEFDEEEDDDEFMKEYRRKRLEAMTQQHHRHQPSSSTTTEPLQIDRTEWTRHVNEASQQRWVVVCLTSSDTDRTGMMERAIRTIARALGTTSSSTPIPSFVFIPAHSAIPLWPVSNLPSLFLYRHGIMQHELVRLRTDLSARDVYGILGTAGVVLENNNNAVADYLSSLILPAEEEEDVE
jgi:hypothetical protein